MAKSIIYDLISYFKIGWKQMMAVILAFFLSLFLRKRWPGAETILAALTIGAMMILFLCAIIVHYYRHFYTDHQPPFSKRLRVKFLSGGLLYILGVVFAGFGLYLFMYLSAISESAYSGLLLMFTYTLKYIKLPAIVLIVGILFLGYMFFFAIFTLTISLGRKKQFRACGVGGMAFSFAGVFLFWQMLRKLGSQIPLSLRVFLNPRWYRMLEIIRQKPLRSFGSLFNRHMLPSSVTCIDISIFTLIIDLLFLLVSFLLVNREVKNLRVRR